MTEASKSQREITDSKGQRSLLLQKIRGLLDEADPETWRKGGEPLNPAMHFEKPRPTWEEVYTLEIEKGTLVFRRSTPVNSEFLGKGFNLKPAARAIYTVELRAKGWHHSELTDPFKRSRLSDRTCNLLAEDSIAEELFEYVERSFKTYHNEQQDAFDKEAFGLVRMLPERLKEETVDSWQRSEDSPGEVHYSSTIDGYTVDVAHFFENGREKYILVVRQGRLRSTVNDYELAKEVYEAVQELGQTSRLLTLTKALESL